MVVVACPRCSVACLPFSRSALGQLPVGAGDGLVYVCPKCMDLLDETVGGMAHNLSCNSCGGSTYSLNHDGLCVCACGRAIQEFGDDAGRTRIRLLYKRIFYFNELISQFSLLEPSIPAEVLALLRAAYQRRVGVPGWRTLTRERIHTLCRSVSTTRDPKIPSCFAVRISPEISRRFASKTGRPLTDLRKYGEKWRRIIFELTGDRPPVLSQDCVETLRAFIANVSRAFELVRHTTDCSGTVNCHRRYGCRHNVINSNYVLKKGFLFYWRGDRRHPDYQAIRRWLPQPNRANRHAIRDRYWRPICRTLGWTIWDTSFTF